MRRIVNLGMGLCSGVILLGSALAFAQDDQQILPDFSGGITTTIGAPLTTSTGLVIVVVVLDGGGRSVALHHYLNAHSSEVQLALHDRDTQSAGARDLAHLFGVSAPHEGAFVSLLFEEREALSPLLDGGDVSAEQARAFGLHLLAAMRADRLLCEDIQRQLHAHDPCDQREGERALHGAASISLRP